MKNNNLLSSDNKLNLISMVYMLLSLFYLFIIVILWLTSGSIKEIILDSFTLILFPLLLPIFLSFIGLRRLSFDINSQYIKMTSDCILMSNISDSYSDKFVLKRRDYNSNYEDTSFFGLRRDLVVVYKKNDKSLKKKINISFLSSSERKKLHRNLIN